MSYKIDIYEHSEDNSMRFLLGTIGLKPLIAVGLNPSTADDKKPDMTISKIIGFASRNYFDSFLMLNLYPQRATFPDKLDIEIDLAKHQLNLSKISSKLREYSEINLLASWGEPILKRDYLTHCLIDLNNKLSGLKINWLQIGDFTKSGHPRHPSRAGYSSGLRSFDFTNYIETFHND